MIRKLLCGAGALVASMGAATAAFAQTAAATAAPTVDKGDTAWMMTSTVLVLMMSVPAVRRTFDLGAMSPGDWAAALAAGVLGLAWFEIYKAVGHPGSGEARARRRNAAS